MARRTGVSHTTVHRIWKAHDLTSHIRRIGRYIDHWNEDPTPFVWTKAPTDIIKKALRCAR